MNNIKNRVNTLIGLKQGAEETDEKNIKQFFLGSVFGSLLGISATLIYQFFQTFLRQPRLISKAILSDLGEFDTLENRSLFIAVENTHAATAERQLDNGEHKHILHAGYRNFRESWARDFGFATYGLLAMQEYQTIKDTLDSFFGYQTPNGQLPVKLQSMNMLSRFMHSLFGREQSLDKPLVPKFITGHRTISLDSQALLVVAACKYISHTDNHDYALKNWKRLQLSMQWLRLYKQTATELLIQRAYADWADSIDRRGIVLYTNVVYWKALREMANLAVSLGFGSEANTYRQVAKYLRLELVHKLWRPHLGYFATNQELDNLSSAGNLLAVAWGLATEKQSNAILDAIQSADMANPVPTQATHPPYRRSQIAIENRLGQLANYHTEAAWLWIGAWHVIALCRSGREEEGRKLFRRISDVIVRDQQVYEVYSLDGQPMSSFWYKSEAPLTWNSAMVVYASQELEEHCPY